jgi:uncharacterized protein (UPF0371 family)
MNTSQVPQFKEFGFDNDKYIKLESEAILERIAKFPNGRLYLEIGGKLVSDPHAARVLPGFREDNKVKIIKGLTVPFDILFCLDYEDILSNRQLSNRSQNHIPSCLNIIDSITKNFGLKPKVVINKIKDKNNSILLDAIDVLRVNQLEVFQRFYIDGYPDKTDIILSNDGYGKDDYIPIQKPLVIVTGAASDSGKMSTCLGQMYLDSSRYNISSGYAKYETFPIWNMGLDHPVNLAYEAATADIGDRNVLDTYHLESYGVQSVNYNRDSHSFKIIKSLTAQFLPRGNYVTEYNSPTDMGISMAGFAIYDDEVVSLASLKEINNRRDWYEELVKQNVGLHSWVKACEELYQDALKYIKKKKYNLQKEL